MNRLQEVFTATKTTGRKLLCPFITAGYPDLNSTVEMLLAVERGGGSVIEVGIPFSDPVADGPVIQNSFTHALLHGVTVAGALDAIRQARARGLQVPVVAMVTFSIIFKKGTREFARMCQQAGVDGVILPDLPLEEAPAVTAAFTEAGIATTLLVTPNTSRERRLAIAKLCTGFIYYVSVVGITGERKALPDDLVANVTELRAATGLPVCVGFGISNADHVRQVLTVADGAIVASAIMRRIGDAMKSGTGNYAALTENHVHELAQGTK